MKPVILVLMSVADILLYTVRSYTNKMFAMSFDDKASLATPVFSAITGFSGFIFSLLFVGWIALPSLTTLLCGICGGVFLFLYDLGNIRAAKTGPYSVQAVIGMFGCVLLPLLLERIIWNVQLSAVQLLGVLAVLISFVFLNMNKRNQRASKKGFTDGLRCCFSQMEYTVLLW